jgi:hypothetical protein
LDAAIIRVDKCRRSPPDVGNQFLFRHNPSVGGAMKFTTKRTLLRTAQMYRKETATR